MNYLNKKTVEDIDVAGKRVLVRCDFNVPFDGEGNISDTKRIDGALPTIKYLVDHNAKVILCSHLGRPKGEFNMKYSLAPVAKCLSEKLGKEVKMAKDVIGEDAKSIAASLKDGEVELLENVRFHKEEEKNDPAFAKELASMAEIYVNDAFGTAHRAHASTAGVADYLPAVCGYLIQKKFPLWVRLCRTRSARLLQFWAAQRSPIKSVLSPTCWTRLTPSSSAAPWLTLS